MSIKQILETDLISASRETINQNFETLDSDMGNAKTDISTLQQTAAQQTVDIAELQMHTFRVNTDGSVTMIIKEASEVG